MKQLAIMLHLKKLYTVEIEKLQAVVQRLETWIDAGLEFRRDIDKSAAMLLKAIAELDQKIEAEQRGEDVGDDWWRGAGE